MKMELKLKLSTCDIKYQCNHFAADNMHGNQSFFTLYYNKFIIHAYNESVWKGAFEFNKHHHLSSEQRWQKEFQHYLRSKKLNHGCCFVLCFPCTDCSAFCLLQGVASAIGEEKLACVAFYSRLISLCRGPLFYSLLVPTLQPSC